MSAIWSAFVMTLKSLDWSIPPIKLEIGCLLRTSPNNSGGAWHSTLRIASTHLCRTAGPTEELKILYRAENIPQVYEEASSVSWDKITSRSSLPGGFISSVFGDEVAVSLPPGQRWICLDVPVSSFVYKTTKYRSCLIAETQPTNKECKGDWWPVRQPDSSRNRNTTQGISRESPIQLSLLSN